MNHRKILSAAYAIAICASLLLFTSIVAHAQPGRGEYNQIQRGIEPPAPSDPKLLVIDPKASVGDYTLSGPFTYQNLSIYLIHGKDSLPGKTYMTLQEAMAKMKVKVYETGSVNALEIENLSDDEIYIQGGDIVKGGRQDRTLPNDFILSAKSGRLPISSFCVEHSRWSQRGSESAGEFNSSSECLSTKSLKIAAKRDNNQGNVWAEVSKTQQRLVENASPDVTRNESASSLQLALESKDLKKMTDDYMSALASCASGKDDVIGYAFAINGAINSADLYTSHDLFKKLWPRLLKASAVEAIVELQKDGNFTAPTLDTVKAAVINAELGQASDRKIDNRVNVITRESHDNVLFETRDNDRGSFWVHRNLLFK